MSGTRRTGVGILLLYCAMATAVGFVDHRSRPYPDRGFTEQVPAVLAGTAEAPGRYRVLAPVIYDLFARLPGLTPGDAWLAFRWLCLACAFLAGHLYFRTWFAPGPAVTGNLLVAALLPLTFTNSWPHPDHLMELLLFTLGCATIARGWRTTFAIVLILSGLNRETSVFLLPLFLMALPWSRTHALWSAALGALWTAIYVGLRWSLGWTSYDLWQAGRNLEFLTWFPVERDLYYRLFAWFVVALALPLVLLAVRAWRRQPRFAKVATTVVAPALLLVGFLFSSVIETRIFTPLLPLLVPGALFGIFGEGDEPRPRKAA